MLCHFVKRFIDTFADTAVYTRCLGLGCVLDGHFSGAFDCLRVCSAFSGVNGFAHSL